MATYSVTIDSVTDDGKDQLTVKGSVDAAPCTCLIWRTAVYGPTAGATRNSTGAIVPFTTDTQRRAYVAAQLLAAFLQTAKRAEEIANLPGTVPINQ